MPALTPEKRNEIDQKLTTYSQLMASPGWKEFTEWCENQVKLKVLTMTQSKDSNEVMKLNGNLEVLSTISKWAEARATALKMQLQKDDTHPSRKEQ